MCDRGNYPPSPYLAAHERIADFPTTAALDATVGPAPLPPLRAHWIALLDFSNVPVPKWPLTCPVIPVILNSEEALLVSPSMAKPVCMR